MALVLGTSLLLASAPALAAKKRVVVLAFSGPRAGQAKGAVERAVKRKHKVVPAKLWTRAQKRLRARGTSPRAVAKVAEDLQVDAIVSGTVKRRGARWSLTVVIREGSSGETLDTVTVQMRAGKLTGGPLSQVTSSVLAAIGQSAPISGGGGRRGGGGSDDDGGDDGGSSGLDDEGAPGVDSDPAGGGDTVADASGGGGDIDSSVSGGTTGGGAERVLDARDVGAEVGVGVSFIGRKMTFNYDPAIPEANRPWGYDGNPVPGGYVTGEVYPMVFSKSSRAVNGIGLAFEFDRIFRLRSRLDSGGGDYATTQQRYGLGLRYRWNFGNKPSLPTIKVGLGYNSLGFQIETGTLANDLPNVKYSYLDVGLGGRMPIGSPKAAIFLDLRYLSVLSTGDMETAANYGTGSTSGLDLDGGIELRPIPKFSIRLGGRYTRMAFDFDGNGTKSSSRDGDPSDQDVGGALDTYLGGYVMGGYTF